MTWRAISAGPYLTVTGLYSYMDQAEVLNTAFFSGVEQEYVMTVMRVYDRSTKAGGVLITLLTDVASPPPPPQHHPPPPPAPPHSCMSMHPECKS